MSHCDQTALMDLIYDMRGTVNMGSFINNYVIKDVLITDVVLYEIIDYSVGNPCTCYCNLCALFYYQFYGFVTKIYIQERHMN